MTDATPPNTVPSAGAEATGRAAPGSSARGPRRWRAALALSEGSGKIIRMI